MAGRIPKNFIDDLIARVDIVDVIGAYVKLTKAGRDYKACCPFHNEKTPSFTVSQEKQFYHCFGCGAHGTAVGFLMEYSGLEFPDAIEQLAEGLGLEVPREGGGHGEDHGPLREVLDAANHWYQQQLRQHARRGQAVDYLKGRGLSGRIAAAFEIGFAPPGRTNLLQALGTDDASRRALAQAGLIAEREPGRFHDRFRNRIMFPIHDRRGQVVGFGGRILDDGQPKYLNSPETPVFHKGRELYGLYQARRASRKLDHLLVVEGYMDVVALAQFGIVDAVATLGTAATGEHMERLFQNTARVVFCFDGDRAGRQAAWRALENALPHMRDGRGVGFVFLPEGEDPDSLVRRHGADRLRERVRDAAALSDVLFEQLAGEHDRHTLEGRSALYNAARPLLERLPPGAFRELAFQRLAQFTELSRDAVEGLPGPVPGPGAGRRSTAPATAPRDAAAGPPRPTLMQSAIRLLLADPSVGRGVTEPRRYAELGIAGGELLAELLELVARHPDLTGEAIVVRFHDRPEGKHLARLYAAAGPLLHVGLDAEFADTLRRLEEAGRRRRLDVLIQRMNETGNLSEADKAEYIELARGTRPPA